MTGGMNFWDIKVWDFVFTLAVLLGAMLLANALRRQFRFVRKTLIPSSVLGGFIVLLADRIYAAITGASIFNVAVLETLTYHGLGLGFVALAWRSGKKTKTKEAKRDVFNTSTVVVGTYLLQAVIGLIISIALFYLIGSYAASGVILPMGYGQGPGQAYNWGNIYQNYTDYPAFRNGASFGLTVAAMGFISASIGGIIYLNRMRRMGDKRAMTENADEIEDLTAQMVSGGGEIPLSESMDKLTVQFALIFTAYALTGGAMFALTLVFDAAGGFLQNTIKPLLWGFNFLTGTAMTILLKAIIKSFKTKVVIKREYTNDFMLNRISGLMFDIMVTASIAAIDLSAFREPEFVLPLLLICVFGAVITYWYNLRVCTALFPNYRDEAFLSLYGMLTGTASTGVILLREIDPLFQSPASHNLIYQNLWSILLGAPMLLMMGLVARGIQMTFVVFGALLALFVCIFVYQFAFAAKRRKRDGI